MPAAARPPQAPAVAGVTAHWKIRGAASRTGLRLRTAAGRFAMDALLTIFTNFTNFTMLPYGMTQQQQIPEFLMLPCQALIRHSGAVFQRGGDTLQHGVLTRLVASGSRP